MGIIQRSANELRTWPRNIKLFFLANVLYQFGTGMFSVLYNLYIQSLGYNDSMNGTVVSVQSLATALMFIPIGLIGDRTSRKRILVLGALLSGAGLIARSLFESEFSLMGLAIYTGLFASFFQVLAIPFLAENTPKQARMRIFSIHASLVLASQVLGSMGGGFLADALQALGMNKVGSLKFALLIGGVATFAAFVPLLFTTDKWESLEPQEPQPVHPDQETVPKQQPSFTKDKPSLQPAAAGSGKTAHREDYRIIGQFALAQLLIGLGSGLVVPYLNLYFTNRFSVSLSAVGILISLGQVMTIVSMLIGPTLVNRVGAVRAVVYFQVMSLPFLVLTGFTNILIVASIGFLFRQALMNAANPIQSSILIDRVPDDKRGIANSVTQTAFMMGWATMGPVQSALVTTYGSYWGYAITFCITGTLYVFSSFLYYRMFREPKRKKVPESAASTL
ncbi:MFS transporter [Paenibacillus lactis]|uniref:MFS family permease n=1 Tax=Paenibacillus lactis TaxID=228574 RepID=A0ABS4FDX9_9BACL|nr:MFS transporter [Paenibacillus lactis]MBP1894408.1 MFS family permease [Paenibacillus lactis]HAF98738.1 MFS transporter [Paenibacillus lactis]